MPTVGDLMQSATKLSQTALSDANGRAGKAAGDLFKASVDAADRCGTSADKLLLTNGLHAEPELDDVALRQHAA
jgi:hypothetical protein